MLKLSKKQYKTLLQDFLISPFQNPLKVYVDFENELLYFLNPETDLIWYTEGSLTQFRKNLGWTLLPKAMLKQANKVILSDKHFIVLKPEELFLSDTDVAYNPVISMFDGISSGHVAQQTNEFQTTLEKDGWCVPAVFQSKPQYEEAPKQAVCALIVRSSPYGLTFLGVSRKDNPRDFGLPGGKVEHRESLYEALYREVLEETGYTITDTALEVFRNTDQDGYEVITLIAKIDRTVERKALAPNETGVVTWVSATELMQGSFGEYNKQLFESLGYPYVSS